MNDPEEPELEEIVRLTSPVQDAIEVTLAEAVRIIMREPLPLKRRSYMVMRRGRRPLTHREIVAISRRLDAREN